MGRENQFFKMPKDYLDSDVFNSYELNRLLWKCIGQATIIERTQIVGRQSIKLEPGQFVTGRSDIRNLFNEGLPPGRKPKGEKTVFRWLEELEERGYLKIEKTNKYSVVTVGAWASYSGTVKKMTIKRPSNDQQMTNKNENFDHQIDHHETGVNEQVNDHINDHVIDQQIPNNKPSNSKGSEAVEQENTIQNDHVIDHVNDHVNEQVEKAASDHVIDQQKKQEIEKFDHNKRTKELKDLKDFKNTSQRFEIVDLENAKMLYDLILANNPTTRQKPNLEKWANVFRLIRERDKQKDSTVKYLLNWCQHDPFWKTNILCPTKFRQKWDKLYLKAKADYEKQSKPKTTGQDTLSEFERLREMYKDEQGTSSGLVTGGSNVLPKLEIH